MLLLQRDPAALQGLLKLGGSELVRQMIHLFLVHAPERVRTASEAVRAGDWTAVERAGHSMKSSAAYLGLTGLQERAARLEELAAQGGSGEIAGLLREVSEALPGLCGLLQELAPSRG